MKTIITAILLLVLVTPLISCNSFAPQPTETLTPTETSLPIFTNTPDPTNTPPIVPSQTLIPATETPSPPVPFPSPQGEEFNVFSIATSNTIKTRKYAGNYDFHFGATPEMSQLGGITGVYYRLDVPTEACAKTYNVFRFYDDGLVIYVPVCDEYAAPDFSKYVWPAMSQWFSRDQIDATTAKGIYYITDNKIWFTTFAEFPSHITVSDYLGTFTRDQLTLDRFTHRNGYLIQESEGREKYVWLDISDHP